MIISNNKVALQAKQVDMRSIEDITPAFTAVTTTRSVTADQYSPPTQITAIFPFLNSDFPYYQQNLSMPGRPQSLTSYTS